MATLDPANIVNGNTVEANDLLQLYQAFGTGSGASITGLAMTGSLYGNALTATTATTATTASNITTAISGGGTFYLPLVTTSGTKPAKVDSDLEYNADTNSLTVTASYATTSSYANDASVSQVGGTYLLGGVAVAGSFKLVAGTTPMAGGNATSSIILGLAGKTLGTNAWITANYQTGANSGDGLMITSISSSGAILFDGYSPPGNPPSAIIVFTGFYI